MKNVRDYIMTDANRNDHSCKEASTMKIRRDYIMTDTNGNEHICVKAEGFWKDIHCGYYKNWQENLICGLRECTCNSNVRLDNKVMTCPNDPRIVAILTYSSVYFAERISDYSFRVLMAKYGMGFGGDPNWKVTCQQEGNVTYFWFTDMATGNLCSKYQYIEW